MVNVDELGNKELSYARWSMLEIEVYKNISFSEQCLVPFIPTIQYKH
jgi:hypothetical protein